MKDARENEGDPHPTLGHDVSMTWSQPNQKQSPPPLPMWPFVCLFPSPLSLFGCFMDTSCIVHPTTTFSFIQFIFEYTFPSPFPFFLTFFLPPKVLTRNMWFWKKWVHVLVISLVSSVHHMFDKNIEIIKKENSYEFLN